jgi:hypothetical protein
VRGTRERCQQRLTWNECGAATTLAAFLFGRPSHFFQTRHPSDYLRRVVIGADGLMISENRKIIILILQKSEKESSTPAPVVPIVAYVLTEARTRALHPTGASSDPTYSCFGLAVVRVRRGAIRSHIGLCEPQTHHDYFTSGDLKPLGHEGHSYKPLKGGHILPPSII